MAQRLYIDFRDGYGERDYTLFLDDRDQFISHELNKPYTFSFMLTPVGDTSHWRAPQRGAFIRFEDTRWLSRVPGARDGVLFTGYLSADPDPVQLGGEGLWTYRCSATSEDYLANLKTLPRKTYVNRTRGYIIKDLLRTLYAQTSDGTEPAPFPLNFDYINDGGTERLFQVDTTKKFTDLVADFAKSDNYRYFVIDSCFIYAPQDEFAPVSSDPKAKLYIDVADPRYTPDNLKLTHISGSVVNDVTVIGLDEPTTIVRETFVSDGYSGFFPLAFTPYGTVEQSLLKEDWTGDSVSDSLWEEFDETLPNYIQPFEGSLNIIGGKPDGSVYLRSRKGVELSGALHFRDGELAFGPAPTGVGYLGCLIDAADDKVDLSTVICGWKLDMDAQRLYPMGPAGVEAASIAIDPTKHYVLRKQLTVDRPLRNQSTYASNAQGYLKEFNADPEDDPNVRAFCRINWYVEVIDSSDPANVVTTTQHILAKSYSAIPDFALYYPVVSHSLHAVLNYTEIFRPQQCLVTVDGDFVRVGNALDGGKCAITTDGGARLNWYALPAPTSGERSAIEAPVTTIPRQGAKVEILYWRSQKAVARVVDEDSVDSERVKYRDDGVRQTTIQAGDIKPVPISTEECLALAQAYISDHVDPRYEGSYVIEPGEGCPTELNYWIYPGDLIPCNIDLPEHGLIDQRLIVSNIKTQFLGKGLYSIQMAFGSPNMVTEAIRQLVLKRASSLDDPSISTINAVTTDDLADEVAPPDPTDWFIKSVSSTSFTVQMSDWTQQAAKSIATVTTPTAQPLNTAIVGYEVRSDDTGWGSGNHVVRFTGNTYTFPRTKRDQYYYIRPYTSDGVYSRRSAFVRVVYPLPNTSSVDASAPSGVIDVNSHKATIQVKLPIGNPDIAGIILRHPDADGQIVYYGDGVSTTAQLPGTNALAGTGAITVEIDTTNPAPDSLPFWVAYYDLLGAVGTGRVFTIYPGTTTEGTAFGVTSVGMPSSEFSTTISSNGATNVEWTTQAANRVLASPDGTAGLPSFRPLAAADIPNLDASKITTGILPAARGGTGQGAYAKGDILQASSINTLDRLSIGVDDSVLVADSTTVTGSKWTDTPRFRRVGIGRVPDSSIALDVAGTYGSDMVNKGNSGAAVTIDLLAANEHRVTLTASTVNLSFIGAKNGFRYVVILKQDTTGSRVPVFPNTFKWQGGAAPSFSVSPGAKDVVTFVYDATDNAYLAAALISDAPMPNTVTPDGAADGNIAVFDGTTGHFLRDSGKALPVGQIVGTTDSQTLTNKTLTQPTIGDFTNATHNHHDATGGGQLDEASLALTDVTTNNVSTTKHGFVPKAPNDATKVLLGDGTWGTPAASGTVTESQIVLSDVTTDNVTTARHGFVPKAPNDTSQYLRGDGAWASLNPSSTGAFGSEPASQSGALYYPNNSIVTERYNGTAWEKWGPIWKLTDPTLQTWTWVNQGSATRDDTHGGIILAAPAGSAGDNHRFLAKSTPAAPYTVTLSFKAGYWPLNYFMYGFYLRESSTGKLIMFGYQVDASSRMYFVNRFNSTTSFNSSSVSVARIIGDTSQVWLRIRDDNTNRYYDVSFNGFNWTQIYSELRTAFFTADQIGFGLNAYNATYGTAIHALHWAEA